MNNPPSKRNEFKQIFIVLLFIQLELKCNAYLHHNLFSFTNFIRLRKHILSLSE